MGSTQQKVNTETSVHHLTLSVRQRSSVLQTSFKSILIRASKLGSATQTERKVLIEYGSQSAYGKNSRRRQEFG